MSEFLFSGFEKRVLTRRTFLKAGALVVSGIALSPSPVAAFIKPSRFERALSFYNTHTGEDLNRAVFWANGKYVPEHLQQINYILRDHRTNEIKKIDPGLMDLLYFLQQYLRTDAPLHIISGYRSNSSNAKLRRSSTGVAKKSLHIRGQAIDLRIPGRNLRDVCNVAITMARGGVGYYPDSEFVHLDTGPFRTW